MSEAAHKTSAPNPCLDAGEDSHKLKADLRREGDGDTNVRLPLEHPKMRRELGLGRWSVSVLPFSRVSLLLFTEYMLNPRKTVRNDG